MGVLDTDGSTTKHRGGVASSISETCAVAARAFELTVSGAFMSASSLDLRTR
jgi:hypothetical protein